MKTAYRFRHGRVMLRADAGISSSRASSVKLAAPPLRQNRRFSRAGLVALSCGSFFRHNAKGLHMCPRAEGGLDMAGT